MKYSNNYRTRAANLWVVDRSMSDEFSLAAQRFEEVEAELAAARSLNDELAKTKADQAKEIDILRRSNADLWTHRAEMTRLLEQAGRKVLTAENKVLELKNTVDVLVEGNIQRARGAAEDLRKVEGRVAGAVELASKRVRSLEDQVAGLRARDAQAGTVISDIREILDNYFE